MKQVLLHCCDFKTDVLDPARYDIGYICLSEDNFVGYLGQWLYVFDLGLLRNKFSIEKSNTEGMFLNIRAGDHDYHYRSQSLGVEYRIHEKIVVADYAICVVKNFNVMEGKLERYLCDHVYRAVDIEFGSRTLIMEEEKS